MPIPQNGHFVKLALKGLITESVIQVELFSSVIQRQCSENCSQVRWKRLYLIFLCRVINLKFGVLLNKEIITVYLRFYDKFTVKIG